MNREIVDLLAGAGLANIVMPRKEFMAEHKNLISLLNKYKQHPELAKEAASQEAEMKSYKGGFSKQSGFIRRMMAENALKHKGQYKKPTDPLAPGSTMSKPVPFEYDKLATPGQKGKKTKGNPYGASPFIQKHFGTAEYVPFERKRGQPLPTEPFPNKKRGKRAVAEAPVEAPRAAASVAFPAPIPSAPAVLAPPLTEAQRDVEEEAPPPPPPTPAVAAAPPPPPPTKVEAKEADIYKPIEYKEDEEVDFTEEKALYRKFNLDKLNYFVPQKGGLQKGAECVWFGVHMGNTREKPHILVEPALKIKPGINLRTVIKKEEVEYFNAYRGNQTETNYYIPPSECVVKDITGRVLKVKEVKLLHTTDFNNFWKLANNYMDGLAIPQVRVIMEQDVETQFHRRIDYAVVGSRPFTLKNELFFSLKEMKELSHKYFTGFYASMVMDGPAKTYAEVDKKLGYSMRREKKLDERQMTEYEGKLSDMVIGMEKPVYTLTMNGIGEWIRLKAGE
jgi:hypothetical protein